MTDPARDAKFAKRLKAILAGDSGSGVKVIWGKEYPPGEAFLQIAQFVSYEMAIEILTILSRKEPTT